MIALLLLPFLQEPAASAAPPAPPVAAPSEPAAAALLARLAAAQFKDGAGRAVDGFDVQLVLRERGEQVQEFDFSLGYSRRQGETVIISILDRNRGTQVRKGFDGKIYWLEEVDEEGQAPRQDLSGHEFEEDREAINDSLELAADLLLVLDLHSLARAAEGLSLTAGAAKERILSGRVRRGASLWEFNLILPEKDGAEGPAPLEVQLRQPNPDPLLAAEQPFVQDRRLKLDKYRRFLGRSVPQEIREFAPGAEEAARILEIHDLHWVDLPLPPPPKKPASPSPPPAAPK